VTSGTKLALRLVALGVVACLLQFVFVSQIQLFGVNADLAPLVVAFAGFLCGSVAGASFGFGVGLFVDLAFVQTLGVSSLIYTLAGYAAGRLRERGTPEAPLTPLALGAGATALAMGGYAVIEFMIGAGYRVDLSLLGGVVATIFVNALIALPLYAVVRRCLIGALPDDPSRRRRGAYTTGGLSPLSRV
jgi:rod shape-determining protein MreD